MWSLMETCLIDAGRQISGAHRLSVDAELEGIAGFLAVGYFERFAYAVT